MFVYSIIFTIIAILVLMYLVVRVYMNKISFSTFIVTAIAMLFVILFSVFPETSSIFANLLGVTRGLDFVFIGAILVLLFISGKLFFIIEDLHSEMDQLVKEVALNNEIKIEEE